MSKVSVFLNHILFDIVSFHQENPDEIGTSSVVRETKDFGLKSASSQTFV